MELQFLYTEEYCQIVARLVALVERTPGFTVHVTGMAYTSVVACLYMHSLSAARTLLRLFDSFGMDWFPVTAGYAIVRPMFEVDVTAHYISKDPASRAERYIQWHNVLVQRKLEACVTHRQSQDSTWRERMDFEWHTHWAAREAEIRAKYDSVRHLFETADKNGKLRPFHSWSGRTIRQMAIEVDHAEAYDAFYAELSSFTHGDIRLANRFLKTDQNGMYWSVRADEGDVGRVFCYAATFLTCMLEFMAGQFGAWSVDDVRRCWDVEPGREKANS